MSSAWRVPAAGAVGTGTRRGSPPGRHPARSERVTFLEEPYELGDTRAVMVEGPSREALALVEIA